MQKKDTDAAGMDIEALGEQMADPARETDTVARSIEPLGEGIVRPRVIMAGGEAQESLILDLGTESITEAAVKIGATVPDRKSDTVIGPNFGQVGGIRGRRVDTGKGRIRGLEIAIRKGPVTPEVEAQTQRLEKNSPRPSKRRVTTRP